VPFGPTRFVDSRIGLGISGPLQPHVPATFAVAGVQGLPTDIVAVTANLTITGQTAAGWVALTATPLANPDNSTVNFPTGDDRANGVFAPLSPTGTVSVTACASVYIIFDVTGYFTALGGATWTPLGPSRFLDTRISGSGGNLSSHVPRSVQVAGVNGVPGNAVGITANVTETNNSGGGYIAVITTPTASPATSTLNFPANDTRANNLTTPLASDGTVTIVYVSSTRGGTTDVILDVTGYFMNDADGATYHPVTPTRVADSRKDEGLNGPIPTNGLVTLTVAGGLLPIPTTAQAVTGNVTETGVSAAGYVSVMPFAVSPSTSTVNFPSGDTRANGFVVGLGRGSIGLALISAGPGQIIVDLTGYFAGGSIPAPTVPAFSGMSLYRSTAWSHQARSSWCAGAATQIMLNLIQGVSDNSSSNQGAYMAFAASHSIYVAVGPGVEADGWANAATYYGAGSYSLGSYPTFTAAIMMAATRMRVTGKPVGLVVKEGHHAWVMAGFSSTGDDPAVDQDFTVTNITVMAPDYGTISYDPAPGSVESIAYLQSKLDGYTDDFPTIWDRTFVIIQP